MACMRSWHAAQAAPVQDVRFWNQALSSSSYELSPGTARLGASCSMCGSGRWEVPIGQNAQSQLLIACSCSHACVLQ